MDRATTIRQQRTDLARLAQNVIAWTPSELLRRFARSLGVSLRSLQRLGAGWSARHQAWAFPMRDAGGQVVGIRLRLPNGRKLAVRSGKEGLFLPTGLRPSGRLLIAEGPTDAGALLDLGFAAVGRPSCNGGARHVVELVQRLHPAEVVVVADGDAPGRVGADRLASTLMAYAVAVRVMSPPAGVKDARAWKQTGATAGDVQAAIDAAKPRRLKITTR